MPDIPVSSLEPRLQRQVENAQIALQRAQLDYVIEVCAQVLRQAPGCVPVRKLQRVAQMRQAQGRSRFLTKAFGSVTQAGFLFGGKKDPARALETAEKVLMSDPANVPALKLLAEAAQGLDLPGTVVFAWEAVKELQPDDAATLLALGEAQLAVGRAKEALRTADELLRKMPQDGDALALMRRASVAQTMEQGKWEAQGSFREKLRDEAQAVSLEQAAKVVTASEMAERLVGEAKARVAAQPENLTHYRDVVEGLRKLERHEEALEWVAKARALPLGAQDGTWARTESELRAAAAEAKIAKLEAEAAARPGDEVLAGRLAEARVELARTKLAEAKAFAEAHPSDYAARFALAELYFAAGDFHPAIAAYQQAQKNAKLRLPAIAGMGKALRARKMFDLAVAQFRIAKAELAAMDDAKKDVIYELASCLEAMGRGEEAMTEYKILYSEDVGFRDVADKIAAHYG